MRTRTDLRNRWIKLSNAPGIFDNTIAPRYAEPHRHYHTLDHIEACLDVLDQTGSVDGDYRDLIEYALWFHDIVYDARRDDNEISSVGVWLHAARNIDLRRDDWLDVTDGILRTIHDNTEHEYDVVSSVVVDIDLNILGAPADVFDAYEANIRREFKFVGNDAFARGRVDVLKRFLAKKQIYATPELHNKYEYRARQNLKMSLERLTGVSRVSA